MKTGIAALIAAVIAAAATFFTMKAVNSSQDTDCSTRQLLIAKKTVQKRLDDLSMSIQSQLQSFSEVVAARKDFSLRLLVENDRSAPEVTELAFQFLKPMEFSVLEITDSSRSILSSGHFPASAGNKSMHKPGVLSKKPAVTMENIMGAQTLTMQAESGFSIAGFRFFVTGGIAVDKKLLEKLSPNENVQLLLKNGDSYTGMDNISSVSAITDNHLIINDRRYPAAEIDLPVAGIDSKISLIVLMK